MRSTDVHPPPTPRRRPRCQRKQEPTEQQVERVGNERDQLRRARLLIVVEADGEQCQKVARLVYRTRGPYEAQHHHHLLRVLRHHRRLVALEDCLEQAAVKPVAQRSRPALHHAHRRVALTRNRLLFLLLAPVDQIRVAAAAAATAAGRMTQ